MTARGKARIAGGLWLVLIALGGFAQFFVRGALIVRGDAAATAHRIMAAEPLFRLGVVADLIGDVCYLGVIFILYELLRPVGRSLSRLSALFGVAGVAIAALNLVNHLAPLVLLGAAPGLSAFSPEQQQALAYLFLRLFTYGYNLSLVFFSGFYFCLVGPLVFRSGFLPRALGVLLTLAGVCYLIGCFASLVAPGLAAAMSTYIFLPGGVAELATALWLLIAGVNAPRWEVVRDGAAARA